MNDNDIIKASVLISIQPKWCELIASGKKTIEVRKTRPKIDVPFKCYIYCTKSKKPYESFAVSGKPFECGGKVIGEFMCGIAIFEEKNGEYYIPDFILSRTGLTDEEILQYAQGKELNFWNISDLVIYDKPKELNEFYKRCYSGCETCKYESWDYDLGGGKDIICIVSNKKPLTRPPQSWCYVEKRF